MLDVPALCSEGNDKRRTPGSKRKRDIGLKKIGLVWRNPEEEGKELNSESGISIG